MKVDSGLLFWATLYSSWNDLQGPCNINRNI